MLRATVALLILLVAGCGSQEPAFFDSIAPDTSTTTTTTVTTAPTTTPPAVPKRLATFDVGHVGLDGSELVVAIADEGDEWQQGLMHLEDLMDLDGMLFVFDDDVSAGFWMKNTLIPLDIAFFTAAGDYVDGFVMEPCTADPCPSYQPDGAYRYALEMPAGTMPGDVERIDVDS
jgi:uncharacterized membrane protein (UPF0127 family)